MKANLRRILIVLLVLAAIGAAGLGAISTMNSPLFVVQSVEIRLPETGPIDAAAVQELVGVAVGKQNLFELDLAQIENRVLANPWVKEVALEKKLPQTLVVQVSFREPLAFFEKSDGHLSYVDQDARVFGEVALQYRSDLTVLSGFDAGPSAASPEEMTERIRVALRLIEGWGRSDLKKIAELATVQWEEERGYFGIFVHEIREIGSSPAQKIRTIIDFGPEPTERMEVQLRRLARVVERLAAKNVAARQIWADSGKKIVVKTAKGS